MEAVDFLEGQVIGAQPTENRSSAPGPEVDGDSIYNGALDNSTGTSGLVQVAGAFAALRKAPARSVLFMAVTAEEQGLLGTAHYASHPVYPLDATVATVNMDGTALYEAVAVVLALAFRRTGKVPA